MIKAVVLDFDGVLTNGSFIWGTDDQEYKQVSFYDIMGISLGHKAGLLFAIISGENSPLIDRFAEKMNIVDVYKGCKDKSSALRSFAEKNALALSHICFMGDDINDIPALEITGFSAAPATANESVKQKVTFVSRHGGGRGAVRELVELILKNNQKLMIKKN